MCDVKYAFFVKGIFHWITVTGFARGLLCMQGMPKLPHAMHSVHATMPTYYLGSLRHHSFTLYSCSLWYFLITWHGDQRNKHVYTSSTSESSVTPPQNIRCWNNRTRDPQKSHYWKCCAWPLIHYFLFNTLDYFQCTGSAITPLQDF